MLISILDFAIKAHAGQTLKGTEISNIVRRNSQTIRGGLES